MGNGYQVIKQVRDKRFSYWKTTIWMNNKSYTFRTNVLIAKALVPNDDPVVKTHCHHINFDKTDNRACNLTWMDPVAHRKLHSDINAMIKDAEERVEADRLLLSNH